MIEPDYVAGPAIAPTLQLQITQAQNAANGWQTSAYVTANATDPGGSLASGVLKLYYSLSNPACSPTNLGACIPFASSNFGFQDGVSGVTTYTAFAEDVAGNFSAVQTQKVQIDTTAPATTLVLSGTLANGAYVGPVTAKLAATDTQSGVKTTYYSWNGGSFVAYTAPVTLATNGSDTLVYYSVDQVGNAETKHTSSFTIVH